MPPSPHPAARALLGAAALATLAAACSSTSGGTAVTLATTTTSSPDPADATTTTTEPPASAGDQLFVYAPAPGDCIDLRATTSSGAATTRELPEADATPRGEDQLIIRLDCGLPHQYEVLDVVTAELPADPPDADLIAEAKRLCPPTFETAIGRRYESSSLEVGWVLPTGDRRRLGDLRIGCLAYDSDGKLDQSVRGSGR